MGGEVGGGRVSYEVGQGRERFVYCGFAGRLILKVWQDCWTSARRGM